jgi:hypothetical protein
MIWPIGGALCPRVRPAPRGRASRLSGYAGPPLTFSHTW